MNFMTVSVHGLCARMSERSPAERDAREGGGNLEFDHVTDSIQLSHDNLSMCQTSRSILPLSLFLSLVNLHQYVPIHPFQDGRGVNLPTHLGRLALPPLAL
jgi:hypothetical protein